MFTIRDFKRVEHKKIQLTLGQNKIRKGVKKGNSLESTMLMSNAEEVSI